MPKIHPVEESNDAGSCEYYHQRVDVSDTIRRSDEFTKLSSVVSKFVRRFFLEDYRLTPLDGESASL